MAEEIGAEIPGVQYDLNAKWDACIDLGVRRCVYSSLAGAFTGLLLFRSPVTRWVSVAFGARVGVGSAFSECSQKLNKSPVKFTPGISDTSPAKLQKQAMCVEQDWNPRGQSIELQNRINVGFSDMAEEIKAEIPGVQYDLNAKWDACIDLGVRRCVYSSLAGAFTGLLLFRSPVTRWVSVAFGAGVGVGSAFSDCSQKLNKSPVKFTPGISDTSPAKAGEE